MLLKLKSKINGDFKNVIYSLMSYMITPIILLISTPLLLANLGAESYGIWILINSILNILAISNFGLGNAMIKIGSEENNGFNNKFIEVFRVIFSVSIILSFIINLILYFIADDILSIFVKGEIIDVLKQHVTILGLIVGLRIISGVLSGSYMAKQRYDLNSKVTIVFNLVTSLSFALIAVLSKNLVILLYFLFVYTIFLLITNIILSKKISPDISFVPCFKKNILKRVFSYGFYSWLQMIINTLNSQTDKLVITALLGPSALGYYTICMQIVSKIHEIPASAGAFLFAKFSNLHEAKQISQIKYILNNALKISLVFIILSGGFCYIFSEKILSIWIGVDFAIMHSELFRLLVLPVSVGALGVIPNYYLNGTGYVRFNTVVSLISSLLIVITSSTLIPYTGIKGAAYGRYMGIPLVIFLLYFILKRQNGSEKLQHQLGIKN